MKGRIWMKLTMFHLDDKQLTKSVLSWLVDNSVMFDFCPEQNGIFEISVDERKASQLEAAFKETRLRRVMHSRP